MKKILISLTIVVAMLCSMGGMAYADDARDLLSSLEAAEFVPGSVPAQSSEIDSVIPPVNAMVMCMLEQQLVYNESSEEFLWNSLYYMISLYGEMDSRAELTDDMMILPAETVEDYAAALFSNYNGLPALPEALKDRVTYDSKSGCYHLARGDASLSELVIEELSTRENGMVKVSGVVKAQEDNSIQCHFTADLLENNSMFCYAISGVNIY